MGLAGHRNRKERNEATEEYENHTLRNIEERWQFQAFLAELESNKAEAKETVPVVNSGCVLSSNRGKRRERVITLYVDFYYYYSVLKQQPLKVNL